MSSDLGLLQGVFFTGSALKVLSIELVPSNREMTGASSA